MWRQYLRPDNPTKIGLVVVGLVAVVLILYPFVWRAPQKKAASPEQFVISIGQSNAQIADALKQQGFIRSTLTLRLVNFIRTGTTIHPGGFLISKSMNVWQIDSILTAQVSLAWVTIPPGVRKEEIADIFGTVLGWNTITKEEWIDSDTVKDPDYIEGVYFPDTYLIPVNETPAAVAARMIAHFQTVFAPYAKQALAENIKWTTVVTMASIIQREAAGPDDMPLIAGIFWNRLAIGMPLQVDSTVQYARGDTPTGWWAPITPADLKIDSPYNTYIYKGLPPHPIDEPSLDAIAAVLSPATTTCLYYIHDNDRMIHCSATFAGHEANIAKYLQ